MNFREWVGKSKDIFGFEKLMTKRVEQNPQQRQTLDPVRSEAILEELARHPIGINEANLDFANRVQWGSGTGAIRAEITPFGSYQLIISKKIDDLEGKPTWICKKVMSLTRQDLKEDVVAQNALDEIHKINQQMTEMPSSEFTKLETLVLSTANQVRINAPDCFVFEGTRKLKESEYVIYMSVRAQGVEAPGARRVNEFCINMVYNENTGLIRCWGHDVSSSTQVQSWQLMPSEWDLHFCPTQPRKEIESAIIQCLRAY